MDWKARDVLAQCINRLIIIKIPHRDYFKANTTVNSEAFGQNAKPSEPTLTGVDLGTRFSKKKSGGRSIFEQKQQ